jgi:hypothetical protein
MTPTKQRNASRLAEKRHEAETAVAKAATVAVIAANVDAAAADTAAEAEPTQEAAAKAAKQTVAAVARANEENAALKAQVEALQAELTKAKAKAQAADKAQQGQVSGKEGQQAELQSEELQSTREPAGRERRKAKKRDAKRESTHGGKREAAASPELALIPSGELIGDSNGAMHEAPKVLGHLADGGRI